MKRILRRIHTETMLALWKLDVLRIQPGKPVPSLWHLACFAPASQSYRAVLVEIGRQVGIAQAAATVAQAQIRRAAAVKLASPRPGKRASDG